MNDLQKSFGMCANCANFFMRETEDETMDISCLVSDVNYERMYTLKCSHFEERDVNILLTNNLRRLL